MTFVTFDITTCNMVEDMPKRDTVLIQSSKTESFGFTTSVKSIISELIENGMEVYIVPKNNLILEGDAPEVECYSIKIIDGQIAVDYSKLHRVAMSRVSAMINRTVFLPAIKNWKEYGILVLNNGSTSKINKQIQFELFPEFMLPRVNLSATKENNGNVLHVEFDEIEELIETFSTNKIVVKTSTGFAGRSVEVIDTQSEYWKEQLAKFVEKYSHSLETSQLFIEPYVQTEIPSGFENYVENKIEPGSIVEFRVFAPTTKDDLNPTMWGIVRANNPLKKDEKGEIKDKWIDYDQLNLPQELKVLTSQVIERIFTHTGDYAMHIAIDFFYADSKWYIREVNLRDPMISSKSELFKLIVDRLVEILVDGVGEGKGLVGLSAKIF